jgi:hypothetical protein
MKTKNFKVYTAEEKVEVYERFFHKINAGCISMNNELISKAISLIDSWSYAHRIGNGELSDEDQQAQINARFERMAEF